MRRQWHNVKKRLPPIGKTVLCCDIDPVRGKMENGVPDSTIFSALLRICPEHLSHKGDTSMFMFDVNKRFYGFFNPLSKKFWSVTHWMPIPPLPTKGNTVIEKDTIIENRFEIMDI